MAQAKHFIPEGLRTLTPHLVVPNGKEAIAFYQKAFGAELRSRAPGATPDATMHADLRIGDSAFFLTDMTGMPQIKVPQGSTPVVLHLFVPDVDALFKQALAAGASVILPVQDMPWGDRYGQLVDPFGHAWSIATHKEELTPEEMERRTRVMFSGGPG